MSSNPVIIASGHKVKPELDFRTGHLYPLALIRNYNYNYNGQGLFGRAWASNFDMSLGFTRGVAPSEVYCPAAPGQDALACVNGATVTKVTASRSDGSQLTYTWNASSGNYQSASPDADDWIVRNSADGTWIVQAKDGSSATYSAGGFVTSVKDPTGLGKSFTYSAPSNGYLQRATYTNGQYIQFSWQSGRVSSVTDPAGQVYTYGYNANGYLTSVTYPASLGITRSYFYENTGLPQALTGIAVNGSRYSTYSYHPNGRAYTSGLLDGSVEKATFVYGSNGSGASYTTYTQLTNARRRCGQVHL